MMTKLRKIILIPALIIVSTGGFFSCGVDRWAEYSDITALDSWMYDIMQHNYLWYRDLPAYNDVNLFQAPAAFLSRVKSKDDSYSSVDSVMEVPLPTYGFDYSLVRSTEIDTAYNALITYVIPGSPAEEAGLKRGDWIMKVDTSYISRKYEVALLQGTQSRDLVMGEWKEVIIEPEEGKEPPAEPDTVYKVVPNEITLEMGIARSIEDNPVHKYEVLTLKDGSKVGYLMYNSFTAGTMNDPEKYNDELRAVSRIFQEANIQTTILDLRYNAGGSLDCVQLLGTIIVPSTRLGKPMLTLEYNNKNEDRNTTINFDPEVLGSGVNLNQQKLIVITSGTTAGAAEMITMGLYKRNNDSDTRAEHIVIKNPEAIKESLFAGEPGIVIIGSAGKGQNIATERYVNDTYPWAINLAVCTVYNSEHVAGEDGFTLVPGDDFKLNETVIDRKTDYSQFLPFGDPKERFLNIAIQTLEETFPPQKETTPKTKSFKIEKSVSSPASRQFRGGLRMK